MPPIPFRLRLLLFFINIGSFNPNKPLNKTRAITNGFMKFINWYSGMKFPGFHSVNDVSIKASEGHEIKLKVFAPVLPNGNYLPVWMYFHGGGFCHGGYEVRSNFCKAIATKANCIVVSVEYRLAPEHPFPAAPNDCFEATQWMSVNAEKLGGDKKRIAVGGESAGGNLAAVVALMARDKGGPQICHQTLLYPTMDAHLNHTSINKFDKGYMLTKALIVNFRKAYLPLAADWDNPYASPLLADLKNLPPALVITAGYDPLKDEGDDYAVRLSEAGVAVTHKRYDNMIHDFTMLMTRQLPEARDSVDMIATTLKKAFG